MHQPGLRLEGAGHGIDPGAQGRIQHGKTLTYGSDAELAAAIADLEARIARAPGTARRRRWGTVATKGL